MICCLCLIQLISEPLEQIIAAAPVFFYFYIHFQKYFFVEEQFDIFSGHGAYFLYRFPLMAYNDTFLGIAFNNYEGPNVDDIFLFFKLFYYNFYSIRYFLLIIKEYLLSYNLGNEETCRPRRDRILFTGTCNKRRKNIQNIQVQDHDRKCRSPVGR